MGSRRMPDASPIENTVRSPSLSTASLSPPRLHLQTLSTNNTEKKEIGEMKLLSVHPQPSVSLRDLARREGGGIRVLNIQNFLCGRNFRILLGVPAGRRVWLGIFHDLWLAAIVWRSDFPAEDTPIFQSIRSLLREITQPMLHLWRRHYSLGNGIKIVPFS